MKAFNMPEDHEKNELCTSWHLNSKRLNNNGMLLEEERPIIPGITVKAATLDTLIDLLIDSFLPVGGLKEENNNFPRIMFLMHQWFTSSEALAHTFVSRFWNSETDFSCQPSCPHTLQQVSHCAVYQYRARICQTFRYWICMFPIHFDLNKVLTTVLQDFQRQLLEQSFGALNDLLDLSKLPSCDWARSMSVRNPPAKHTRKISLVFDHLEPVELADHITFLEHKVMRRITFSDFKAYAECGTPQDNPKLERSISLFNGLSQWIQWMVLSKSLPQQRADVIVKFVHLAEKLLQQNNFNSLMSVVGGLSHSALARLTNTMSCVPLETQKTLSDLTHLLASASNFSNYRKALADTQGFRIPILGVHMKDLISLHVALPDSTESGLINFRKIAQLSLIFQELWELQNSVPNVAVNADLVNTLRLSLNTPYTEDELYELSLAKEPRNSSPQSSPTKLTAFSEWASGAGGQPDKETLEKFYQSIVDEMMKNYDCDKDGYLNTEEYEMVATNFPYIDTFSVLDADKDGMISKSDMKSYFCSVNSKAVRVAFQHDFHETTYFKPTFCGHCAGLLWGLIKQGYKCRDCGINAHKHCKELVVMECRRSSGIPSRSNSFATSDGVKIKGRIQRPWRRQLKSSHSDGESSLGSRASTESDMCSCDNGFVIVDEQPSEFQSRSLDLKEPLKSPTEVQSKQTCPVSPRLKSASSGSCSCKQEYKTSSQIAPKTPETDHGLRLCTEPTKSKETPAQKHLIS